MMILLLLSALILTLGPGGAGSSVIAEEGAALDASRGEGSWISWFVNSVGLAGLVASFFSIIFAYSRQVFALSRAGYLPRFLSRTGRRKTPVAALVIPGAIGFGLSLSGEGDLLILVAVFGATISYAMMMLAHIVLRAREPELPRPYRTPGGAVTAGIALVLAVMALVAGFLVNPMVLVATAGVYGIHIGYFALYSRHHLVAQAPEEEFAAIRRAEAELESREAGTDQGLGAQSGTKRCPRSKGC